MVYVENAQLDIFMTTSLKLVYINVELIKYLQMENVNVLMVLLLFLVHVPNVLLEQFIIRFCKIVLQHVLAIVKF